MITLKDLQNRVYRDKECVKFEYGIPTDEKGNCVYAQFYKLLGKHEYERVEEWSMQIVFNRTRDKDSEVYTFGYVMPRKGLPLELIAATGLKYFQLHLKEEVQAKSNMDFELGNILQGM